MMAVNNFISKFSFLWLIVLSQNSASAQSFECGVPYIGEGLAENGVETVAREHPWKVALLDVLKGQEYFCGGVLIDDETVLTAAHCLDGKDGKIFKPRDISVLLGAHNLSKETEKGRKYFSAASIQIHEKWNSDSLKYNNDIALVKLNGKVTFDEYIQPVCLPTTEILNINDGTVVGWGQYDDSKKNSEVPREVEVPILNAKDCLEKNISLVHPFDKTTMFCAGKDGVGVCKGDGGSGFYVKKDGRFYVRGIVSSRAGSSCSSKNYVLYSDISKNLNFFNKVISA